MKNRYLKVRSRSAFILSVLLGCFLNNSYSQTTYTIGTGTTTSYLVPVNSLYNFSYNQSIYPAADLTAQGMEAGMEITTLRYFVDGSSSGSVASNDNWTVYMGNTTTTQFTSTTSWIPAASLTQVYTGNVTWTNGNWMTITLATPFIWNGQNLVIAVDENSTSYSYSVNFRYTAGAANSSIIFYSDGTNPNPNSPGTANTRNAYLPNIQLVASMPPPVPIQDPATPTCLAGTELSMVGAPATGDTWYWQTTATGTSTANDASSPWTVFANGTYYVRTFTAATNSWSAASSVTVSNFPTAPTPPAPFAGANPACNSTQVASTAPPAGTIYYWQTVPNGVSTANNAATPLEVTSTGTYYMAAYETATGCWSTTSSTSVTIQTTIPLNPITPSTYVNACSGSTSIQVSGQPQALTLPYKLRKIDSYGDGWNNNTIDVLVNGVVVLDNVTLANGLQEDQPFNVPEGAVITTVWNGGGSFATEVSYRLVNQDNVVVGSVGTSTSQINYTVPMPAYPLTWYDAPTGGNIVGTGSPFETVGSSLISNPAGLGSYEFYLGSSLGACESAERTLVTVNVTPVDVVFATESVTCNNGNDGTFDVTSILCGNPPLAFSVDGGAFSGIIPTDLTVGEHTIVVKDANDDESAEYIITIGNALAPFDVTELVTTNNQTTITWTAPGGETQWNVVWGPQGFTPGDADEIGSAIANDTVFTIIDLLGNTEYDIYVSANCGNGTVPGDWNFVEIWTDCDVYNLPFVETFNTNSNTIVCWGVEGIGDGAWYVGVGANNNGPVTAPFAGDQNALFQGSSGSSARLISPTLMVTGQDSVAVMFAISQADWIGDQNTTTLAKRNGTSGAWTVVKSYTTNIPAWMLDTVIVNTTGMDSLQLSFLAYDDWGYNNTIDEVIVEKCFIEPTADGAITVCRTDGSIDLTTVSTPMFPGVWDGDHLNSLVNGSNFNFSNLVEGTYEIKHISRTACAYDTAVVTVVVTAPKSAGIDGTLNVCKNQPIGLFTGLSGNVDYGGTWYTAAGVALTGSTLTTGTLQGQQVYTYVVSNGICDADTSTVIVNIGACNFIGVDDVELFDNVTISPNPSTGVFNIEGVKSPDFTYEVVDMNGRIIKGETKITSSVTSVNLSTVETGVYMIRLKGEGSEKMIRLIKQ